jgi:poly(A) polymerase/tRNA nucleotidyltransferase (CCA-adding enzyme)
MPGLRPVLAALPDARLVGGAVRDTLAGLPVSDIDLATPEPPEAVAHALSTAGFAVVPTGIAHGTVTAVSDGRNFEITTLRRDTETDGRHATVVWTDSWKEDAARRDFTINAMSMDRYGIVFDYFGGQADLAAGQVRFVGDPATRIAEDYLRILRFFRFWARYGRGAPDEAAVEAIAGGIAGLTRLSAERVWSELKRILAAPDPIQAVALMRDIGVLRAVLPEAGDSSLLAGMVAAGAPADPLLRLAALVSGDSAALAERLKLSKAEAARLAAVRAGAVPEPGAAEADLRRLLADEAAATLIDRTWLARGYGSAWDAMRARLTVMPTPVFPLSGRDALALGAPPGEQVGIALRAVRAWWLAGGCGADAPACRAELANALLRLMPDACDVTERRQVDRSRAPKLDPPPP